jgi:hypothetical protein
VLTGAHKVQIMASGLTSLELYHKNCNEFFSHNITDDETWVSFRNFEMEEWIHIHSSNKMKKLNRHCLLSRKQMGTLFLDRKGLLMLKFMQ